MENNVEQITDDRITQIPKDLNKKVKDPRKVAAGKLASERNAKRKKKESENGVKITLSTIFNGIQNLSILVSSGFVLYHGYNFVKKSYAKKSTPETPETEHEEDTIPETTTSNDLDF